MSYCMQPVRNYTDMEVCGEVPTIGSTNLCLTHLERLIQESKDDIERIEQSLVTKRTQYERYCKAMHDHSYPLLAKIK